ncbi:DMSO/TMAO reductase YedYZ, molybdopterin-dependent catalytic subunit [Rhodovulum sp. ES.010]|uniref:sulfite oxidase n=1 Tax=Rhodovulum sp. ES.010 TaxID=1882821 RepID=UPI00092B8EE1|nr:sulfite oxidase [Rhodovulum sp. ES.010]SIO54467.1 DMSO/TMAO reductase YedYZ, molybdopterin-dependent catalytic subunit [Rhodovulum sp. ES.010]
MDGNFTDDTAGAGGPNDRDRRRFLRTTGLAALSATVAVPFARFLPEGMAPIGMAHAAGADMDAYQFKDGLTLLNDRPINAETPAHLLDDKVTPANRLFIRNNGRVPEHALAMDASGWTLTVDGEVDQALDLTLDQLESDFEVITRQLTLECGGNGRAFFVPGASGNQWTTGAVGCPEWTGVRLRDVLNAAGVRDTAVYTGHFGTDPHLSGDPEKLPISRGIPIAKALEEDALIAWAMNGEPLPAIHGFPLRLVVPGYPGSASQKWLTRIRVRDQVHDGPKMGGYSYRLPAYPVAPGTEVPESDMVVMETMPVKSLITSPATRAQVDGLTLDIRGHAWADGDVAAVHVSHDFGQTWAEANLEAPANRYAWQHFSATVDLPQAGYYEIWSRATDTQGRTQPVTTPGWNPRGYGNNMVHRIAVLAG